MIKDIFRSNTQLFPVGQLIATSAILYMIYQTIQGAVAWEWWLASYAMYFCTGCLGITITFHRYLTSLIVVNFCCFMLLVVVKCR